MEALCVGSFPGTVGRFLDFLFDDGRALRSGAGKRKAWMLMRVQSTKPEGAKQRHNASTKRKARGREATENANAKHEALGSEAPKSAVNVGAS